MLKVLNELLSVSEDLTKVSDSSGHHVTAMNLDTGTSILF